MKASIEKQVEAHGEKIKIIFDLDPKKNAVSLCRQLRRIEREGNELGEDMCNLANADPGSKRYASLVKKLDKILGFRSQGVPVFVNLDPRGYALKIESEWVWKHREDKPIYQDWGGFGIIAPEFTEQ